MAAIDFPNNDIWLRVRWLQIGHKHDHDIAIRAISTDIIQNSEFISAEIVYFHIAIQIRGA